MASDRRLILVVEAAVAATANTRSKEVDTVGGDKTFTVGLSASGSGPVTHYWCNWQMTLNEQTALLAKLQPTIDAGRARVFDAKSNEPEDVLATLGLKRVEPKL